MKKYIGLLLMLFSLEATAQLHMKANLQTNHLWRGIEVADGLVITGDVNYSLCNGLFISSIYNRLLLNILYVINQKYGLNL